MSADIKVKSGEKTLVTVVEVYAGYASEHTECASPPSQGRQNANTSTLDHQSRSKPSFSLNVCVCCGIRQ